MNDGNYGLVLCLPADGAVKSKIFKSLSRFRKSIFLIKNYGIDKKYNTAHLVHPNLSAFCDN